MVPELKYVIGSAFSRLSIGQEGTTLPELGWASHSFDRLRDSTAAKPRGPQAQRGCEEFRCQFLRSDSDRLEQQLRCGVRLVSCLPMASPALDHQYERLPTVNSEQRLVWARILSAVPPRHHRHG